MSEARFKRTSTQTRRTTRTRGAATKSRPRLGDLAAPQGAAAASSEDNFVEIHPPTSVEEDHERGGRSASVVVKYRVVVDLQAQRAASRRGTSGSTSQAAPPPPVAQPGASNAPGTRENYVQAINTSTSGREAIPPFRRINGGACHGQSPGEPTPNSSSKRRRLEGPADESLSESPVEVAESNADGSGVDPPSQVAESSHLVEDDATPLLVPPELTMAVVMSPEEWRQLLSSDLGNETLRNIARDIGDKAMNKMLSIENEYANEEVVQKKPRAKRTGDRMVYAATCNSRPPILVLFCREFPVYARTRQLAGYPAMPGGSIWRNDLYLPAVADRIPPSAPFTTGVQKDKMPEDTNDHEFMKSHLSVVSSALAISNFPVDVQGILSNAYDDDGDGHISTNELVEGARLKIRTEKCNSMLWKGIGLAVVLVVALIGLNAGLTYGIIDANKDTEVQGRALLVREKGMDAEVPVATSNNEITVTLATIPFLPSSAVSHIQNLAFSSEDGSVVYHRKVRSADVRPDQGLTLMTTQGDLVEWDLIDDAKKLSITLQDGTAWKTCMHCTECTAGNIYSTPDILDALDSFEAATGKEARRHLGTFSRRLQNGGRGDRDCNSC
ncbi:hypothetical protein THAOC_19100 [Thalassiosira oceanica]|uniref:EF-hand domain-containing protein n=1 Tax=Thalassiosira oceanica TaxID=159749 RepID=K0S5H0_THAOC|nr:hypothetical protein THAOC_19100 [Thalassiosira oceanica]|eukprot:EJK60525.1 hypothetical protein THAOC_19100 [Thalassiosira oceanica]